MRTHCSVVPPAKSVILRISALLASIVIGATSPLSGQTIPAGTTLRIRFLEPITSGNAKPQREIRAQSLGALESGTCIVVPAFTPLIGTIETSRAGRTALERGSLRIGFDSIEIQGGQWLSFSAVLDSLEWSPRRVENGTAFSGRKTIVFLAGERLSLLAAGVAAAPAAAIEAAQIVRDRSRVSILAGEEAVIRLDSTLAAPPGFTCDSLPPPAGLVTVPALNGRTSNASGTVPGDPINILFLGGEDELEKAFAAANWSVAYRSTKGHLARGVSDAILKREDAKAPVSPQYYDGHAENIAFERASPSARIRHHVRFWKTDSTMAGDTVWVGAANQDIGLLVTIHGVPTHRIDSLVDQERELIVRELQAGACVRLQGYARLPDTRSRGVNVARQRFVTDQLAAVVRHAPCGE